MNGLDTLLLLIAATIISMGAVLFWLLYRADKRKDCD